MGNSLVMPMRLGDEPQEPAVQKNALAPHPVDAPSQSPGCQVIPLGYRHLLNTISTQHTLVHQASLRG